MRPIRNILCPLDFTAVSDRELELATELATRFHAGLILQHNVAIEPALDVSWLHEERQLREDAAGEKIARTKLTALLDGLPPAVHERARGALTYGAMHRCVANLAAQSDVDLIVIGTHGREGADHSSETERLIGVAPCPVLTTRDDAPQQWLAPLVATSPRIPTVVPIDFSEHSLAALRYALDLQRHLPLEITVLYVPQHAEFALDWAEVELAKAFSLDERKQFELEVKEGTPVEQILAEESALNAHLVVMGAHVAGWIERLLFAGPSTSREILHRSACPVWFVPASAQI
jgi:nucleotide-binding universal stress UspA family protein